MPYTKQTWTNDDPDTPLSAERMGHIETGIETAASTADSASAAASAAQSAADDAQTTADAAVTTAQLNTALGSKQDELTGTTDVPGLEAILDDFETRIAALEGAGA